MKRLSRSHFLALDGLQPFVDLAAYYRFEEDMHWEYRIPYHHLFLLESGVIEAKHSHGQVTAKAGDFLCFRPAELNIVGTHGRTLVYMASVGFALPPKERFTPWLEGVGPLPFKISLGSSFGLMRQVFETLCLELNQSDIGSQLRVRAAILELLAIIADMSASQRKPQKGLDHWQRIRLRLDSRVRSGLKIEHLAQQVGLSTSHFIRQFKQRFGVSPKLYHTHAKMREASRALRNGNEPIKTIAYDLGFTNPKTFARTFKRHMGMSPARSREKNAPIILKEAAFKHAVFPTNQHIHPPKAEVNWLWKYEVKQRPPSIA